MEKQFRQIWDDPDMTSQERLVLICLLCHAKDGRTVTGTNKAIAARTALSTPAVSGAVKRLEHRGLIHRQRLGSNFNSRTEYTILQDLTRGLG